MNIFPPPVVLQAFENSSHICILTGAGISAESGVPTFRGNDGLWSKYRPEDLANPEAFAVNPELVWSWYQYRIDIIGKVRPNPGHNALARWETITPDFTLITQNIDGLHRIAGNSNILELHGNIRLNRCCDCGARSSMDEITFSGSVPRCFCGGMLRPDVVWFGEALPEDVMQASVDAAGRSNLFLTVGTSALVYPAASLPMFAAQAGAVVIEVNTEETPFTSQATCHMRGPAGSVLPELLALYRKFHPELTATPDIS